MYKTLPIIDMSPMWMGRALRAETDANQLEKNAIYWKRYAAGLENQILQLNQYMPKIQEMRKLIEQLSKDKERLVEQMAIVKASALSARERVKRLEQVRLQDSVATHA